MVWDAHECVVLKISDPEVLHFQVSGSRVGGPSIIKVARHIRVVIRTRVTTKVVRIRECMHPRANMRTAVEYGHTMVGQLLGNSD